MCEIERQKQIITAEPGHGYGWKMAKEIVCVRLSH